MKKVLAIRFDDICPTMDYTQFRRALNLMDKYDVKPLLGIVPECQDSDLMIEIKHPDFWDEMLRLQKSGYVLAMHGCRHVYQENIKSEFVGLSYEEQYRIIKRGKEILASHDINTDIFFAPAHSYDRITLKALAANGFHYISDGMTAKPCKQEGIICIPARSYGIPHVYAWGGIYVAVCHAQEWTREDKKYDYERLVNFIERHHGNIVPFTYLLNMKLGWRPWQFAGEKMYLFYCRNIFPLVKKIYKNARKFVYKDATGKD